MKTILDLEHPVARCNLGGSGITPGRTSLWTLCVHTQAILSGCGSGSMLRMEQRCYLRAGSDLCDQPWIKPRLLLEPCATTEDELLKSALEAHESFQGDALRSLPPALEMRTVEAVVV